MSVTRRVELEAHEISLCAAMAKEHKQDERKVRAAYWLAKSCQVLKSWAGGMVCLPNGVVVEAVILPYSQPLKGDIVVAYSIMLEPQGWTHAWLYELHGRRALESKHLCEVGLLRWALSTIPRER